MARLLQQVPQPRFHASSFHHRPQCTRCAPGNEEWKVMNFHLEARYISIVTPKRIVKSWSLTRMMICLYLLFYFSGRNSPHSSENDHDDAESLCHSSSTKSLPNPSSNRQPMPSAVVEPIFARHATLQWWLWWPDRIIAVYLCNNHMCICATLIPRCAWFAYSNIYI